MLDHLLLQKNRPPPGHLHNLGRDTVPSNLQNGRDNSIGAIKTEYGDVALVLFERLGESDRNEAKAKVRDGRTNHGERQSKNTSYSPVVVV